MKTSGFEIGHDTEVTQGAKASGQTLGEWEQTVKRFDGPIGQPSFQESDNAALGQLLRGTRASKMH